jgi:cell division protein ZapE
MAYALLTALEQRIATGQIELDPAQRAAAQQLDRLADALSKWRPPGSGILGGLFGSRQPPPRGLYIHGKVGRGKTMLMDLFYDEVEFTPKRRVHFHAFMSEVHDLINTARKREDGDPISYAASQIAANARLICFDEFHVTDIADAMILGRLFTALFAEPIVLVATSNVPPSGLYRDGLNRQLFLPFVALLEATVAVLELASARDYRLEKLAGQSLYFSPTGPAADNALREVFFRLTGKLRGEPRYIDIKGRRLRISEAAEGVAFVTFAELCDSPLGANDYLGIADAFHSVILSGIPILAPERRAAARRLVTLVDTLYDRHVGLIVSADAEPDALHPEGDESFLFERTASRLIEMRSPEYLAKRKQTEGPPSADRSL